VNVNSFKDLLVKVGTQYVITLPQIKDDDGDSFTITIDNFAGLGLYQFCELKYPQLRISPSDSSHAGTYPVNIVLTDKNPRPLSNIYSFVLEVYDPSFESQNSTSST
jgi:hypothetical protein